MIQSQRSSLDDCAFPDYGDNASRVTDALVGFAVTGNSRPRPTTIASATATPKSL